ncbi:MAG: hypothetical protein P8N13_04560 [Ilumatobacter sp.]|nr:hypothetical protein [Ilumatobacter sp.]
MQQTASQTEASVAIGERSDVLRHLQFYAVVMDNNDDQLMI